MGKIFIRTYAYNAEKTLRRAVDSVLGQTHGDFAYYLCDNGSRDGTVDIVEEYARLDKRIKPFHNKVNRAFHETEECMFLPYNIADDDYYCLLDADDEYLPTFFQEMLAFMDANKLDIAACGSDFLSVPQNNRLISRRILPENLILEGRKFTELFTLYHVFMRTTWAKLSKGWTLRNTLQDSNTPGFPRAYGGDTYNTMLSFSSAKRVGILAKSLHKYYVSPKSVSYAFHPQRVETDQILHKATLEYLAHFGKMSRRNEDFVFVVYLNAVKDTWEVLQSARIPLSEKLTHLEDMLSCDYTRQLAARESLGTGIGQAREIQSTQKAFFHDVADWLLSLSEVPDEWMERFCEMGGFCSAASGFAEGWILFNKLRIGFLIDQKRIFEAKKRLADLEEILPGDPQILEYGKKLDCQRAMEK